MLSEKVVLCRRQRQGHRLLPLIGKGFPRVQHAANGQPALIDGLSSTFESSDGGTHLSVVRQVSDYLSLEACQAPLLD